MNRIPPFTVRHAALLERFLMSPQRPNDTLNYPQLAGFLFAMANGPEMITPSEWIPMVFNDQEAGYETRDEAEQVLHAMMALYNDCGQERTGGSVCLPPGCEIRSAPLDNFLADASLGNWAQGFSMGHDYLVEIWRDYTPEELDEELGAILMVLTCFASPKLSRAYYKEGKGSTSFESFIEAAASIFSSAMREYAHLGRSIYQARRDAGDLDLQMSIRPKIGRNDPCPCGSGKKFKKCCGAN